MGRGYLVADPRPTVDVVFTSHGKTKLGGNNYPRSRVWVLGDRTVVLCVPASPDGSGVSRIQGEVAKATYYPRAKRIDVELSDGRVIETDYRNCACSMGAAGSAGPIDGPYSISRVRSPDDEWWTVIR